jgi:RecG-like helicase
VLVSDSTDETAVARLKAAAELNDGFELAERDFELRREGDVLGFAQSGLPGLRVASLTRADHRDLAVRARSAAERTLDRWTPDAAGRSELEPLFLELEDGWLRHLVAADPASGS